MLLLFCNDLAAGQRCIMDPAGAFASPVRVFCPQIMYSFKPAMMQFEGAGPPPYRAFECGAQHHGSWPVSPVPSPLTVIGTAGNPSSVCPTVSRVL